MKKHEPGPPGDLDAGYGMQGMVETGLQGVTVLDLSTTLPGPYCSQLLRRLGAEVIAVEPPAGDSMRSLSKSAFARLAAGKQSVTANLKDPADRAFVAELARTSDVLIEGWRPGVADRLGVGYAGVSGVNPRIVYCSITGYGQEGELSAVPGHDINYVAEAGALDYVMQDGLPLGDLSGAIFAALRITSALKQVDRTGEGIHLDVSLTGALWDFVHVLGGEEIEQFFQFRRWPHYGIFRTADGQRITLGVAREDRLWANLIVALGRPEWVALTVLEREVRSAEIRDYLAGQIESLTLEEVTAILSSADTCWSPSRAPGAPARTEGRLQIRPGEVSRLDGHGVAYRGASVDPG
jgi:crotonobetainyl-CoA:carnitine CoA-transferase CaiB-like acyl-CoA transferase